MTALTRSSPEPCKLAHRQPPREVTPQFNGEVAVNREAVRGLGRSDAVGVAEKGADIIGFELCDQIDSADEIRNAEPCATDPFLASAECRNV
jgi:hypothetical protein